MNKKATYLQIYDIKTITFDVAYTLANMTVKLHT